MKKLITSKNHISQYFPLEPKFRVFPSNYHWEFPPLVFPGQPWSNFRSGYGLIMLVNVTPSIVKHVLSCQSLDHQKVTTWQMWLFHEGYFAIIWPFYTPARRESGEYRDPHVRPSVHHTFGFRIIIKVPLNQIFSNFHTMLCTIKYRLSLITVYFTFTVHELWPFFS